MKLFPQFIIRLESLQRGATCIRAYLIIMELRDVWKSTSRNSHQVYRYTVCSSYADTWKFQEFFSRHEESRKLKRKDTNFSVHEFSPYSFVCKNIRNFNQHSISYNWNGLYIIYTKYAGIFQMLDFFISFFSLFSPRMQPWASN